MLDLWLLIWVHLNQILRIIKRLLCDRGSSHEAPLNHFLGDLAGHHAAGLCVLCAHHHAFCWKTAVGNHEWTCSMFFGEQRWNWSVIRTWEEGVVEHGVGDVSVCADVCWHVENFPPHWLVVVLRQRTYRGRQRTETQLLICCEVLEYGEKVIGRLKGYYIILISWVHSLMLTVLTVSFGIVMSVASGAKKSQQFPATLSVIAHRGCLVSNARISLWLWVFWNSPRKYWALISTFAVQSSSLPGDES